MAAPTRRIVLGTAGHIDHGKTSLVRALTGIDTDRLPEEQRRGITIELGFAAFELATNVHVAVVDVPGHEALVRTMIAGAGGIDMVLLAISAEDGVMPQTREHLHVCELLGLRHGVVALTKIDRLGEGTPDEELLALASEDVRAALAGTALADAPVVPISARTGVGLDALRAALLTVARKLPERPRRGEPILPIDRVFTLRGQGTVVTGTLVAGTLDLETGDDIEWRAQGQGRSPRTLRVRGMHSQGRAIERAQAGMRVALALANVAVDELARGDVLTRGARVVESRRLLARIHQLEFGTQPWTRRSGVQVCVATAHAAARLVPLAVEREDGSLAPARELGPGETGLARIYLDVPLPVWSGQRIILRAFTAEHAEREGLTIGGGTILDPLPGRGQPERRIALARALLDPDPRARVLALIRDAGPAGIDELELTRRTGVESIAELLGSMHAGILALGAGRWADASLLDALIDRAIAEVERFHVDHPLQPGMPRATLERSLASEAMAGHALALAIERRALRVADRSGSLARPKHAVLDPLDLPPPLPAMLERYAEAELAPPTLRELAEALGLELRAVIDLASLLHRHELLIRVSDELSYDPAAHAKIVAAVREHLREQASIDVQALKLRLGLTRKFAVPLLEHLDRLGVTRRSGDVRVPGRAAQITREIES
ncbi:selenocysteine-specific translation elongation factor [Nannocystaceae bacterium ST9]